MRCWRRSRKWIERNCQSRGRDWRDGSAGEAPGSELGELSSVPGPHVVRETRIMQVLCPPLKPWQGMMMEEVVMGGWI